MMRRIIFILIFLLFPALTYGSTASDFIVNSQPTYVVPSGTTKLLILDLTLPDSQLKSIKIINAGTVQQQDLSLISIYQDGSSAGWDGDETEMVRKSSSPFWDTDIEADFSKQRIFVTVDLASLVASGRTIKPQLKLNSVIFADPDFNGPTDSVVTGLEREIMAGVSMPYVPVSPMAKSGEALSASTIRWYFTDLSNNEFGFKILDENLNEVARKEEADLSYLDETGLEPDTEYSYRKIFAFNDRGTSLLSSLVVFPTVRTLALPPAPAVAEEVRPPAEVAPLETTEEAVGGPLTPEELRTKIQELQLQLIELLQQLIQLFQEELVRAGSFLAGLWFLQSFFGR